VHRSTRQGRERRYGLGMKIETTNQNPMADEFEARAATFRRVAEEMRDPDDRDELLRIAAAYEGDAERLRKTRP
jgi:hypothetical protein